MATATAEKTASDTKSDPASVIEVLLDQTIPLDALLKKCSPLVVGRAWAAGEIEIGRRTHVTVGKGGVGGRGQLVVESTMSWSGPKKAAMKSFKDILAEGQTLPVYDEYREYPPAPLQPVPESEAHKSPLKTISAADANALCAWSVRLTDKGLAALEV